MSASRSERVPEDTPDSVRARVAEGPREPEPDPTLRTVVRPRHKGAPPHRLVTIGDSLTHGMQSGAVFNTDLSYPAIIAYELGWLDRFRFPRYGGPGGLPLNLELLLRRIEKDFGPDPKVWDTPLALFAARSFMDEVEDYWERGPGRTVPALSTYVHDLAVYGWDLRDALSKTAATCADAIAAPNDNLIDQQVQNGSERAALRVYPGWSHAQRQMTLFQAAAALGEDHDDSTECGIETLVVFLGANNALRSVTDLRVVWSGNGYRDLKAKNAYTVWTPEHFAAEFAEVVAAVKAVKARHVIWCTVPHVTIAPIARGIGDKVEPGSRYFPYYVRPWVSESEFSPEEDAHITGGQARVVDAAIDLYNDTIARTVLRARKGTDGRKRDWYLLDTACLLDRLASRRYIADRHMRLDPELRPTWWSEYRLPGPLLALDPVPNSRFLTGDGKGGRATGGLFSLDGVHPTTIGYGIIAQEIIDVMRLAGVEFRHVTGAVRADPVAVDFARLILRDTLVRHPPQNITSTLEILGWLDRTMDWVKRTLSVKV
ncbi:hypothetical protein [Rhodococcus sp. NPDC058514]|uniref:hypothetical protein n=1 Tax=unclassified Rhodococcus (in: high G+C Gram-positive bacteria) TaxID=192944 RepID=UPI00365FCBE9